MHKHKEIDEPLRLCCGYSSCDCLALRSEKSKFTKMVPKRLCSSAFCYLNNTQNNQVVKYNALFWFNVLGISFSDRFPIVLCL